MLRHRMDTGDALLPPYSVQFWCGMKKTGILSGPLFLAILAGSASFVSPREANMYTCDHAQTQG
eukprot:353256-Prymnesium_polylepis.1